MRPIVAGPQCITSRLSNFLDKILRPYLKAIKSHIREDVDFLLKMPRETDEKKVLATFDIINMYTNIDNDLGQEAIGIWLEKHPELLPRNISKATITRCDLSATILFKLVDSYLIAFKFAQ